MSLHTIGPDRLHQLEQQALLTAAQQRVGVLRHWLLTLPDADISDDARRDGLALLNGEREPGRI
jgi:hypothetical protein